MFLSQCTELFLNHIWDFQQKRLTNTVNSSTQGSSALMWYLSGEIKALIPNEMLLTVSHKQKPSRNFSARCWHWGMTVDGKKIVAPSQCCIYLVVKARADSSKLLTDSCGCLGHGQGCNDHCEKLQGRGRGSTLLTCTVYSQLHWWRQMLRCLAVVWCFSFSACTMSLLFAHVISH